MAQGLGLALDPGAVARGRGGGGSRDIAQGLGAGSGRMDQGAVARGQEPRAMARGGRTRARS